MRGRTGPPEDDRGPNDGPQPDGYEGPEHEAEAEGRTGGPPEPDTQGSVGESKTEDATERFTDLGNAQRFARIYGDKVHYVHAWHRWLVWDGKRWAPNDRGQVQWFTKNAVKEMYREAGDISDRAGSNALAGWAFRSESEARINSTISLARTEPGIPVLPEELDSDPWLFNVENGTIDLKTGKLREHYPDDLITKLAPVEYDPSATAERFEQFLLEIMDGRADLVSFLKRCVGYSMTGTTTEHVLLFLHGRGANGKTTFLNILLKLFGGYGKQSDPELLLRKRSDAHPTGVADLKGARLVATSEIDAGRHMAESLVKQLTGGDRITARFMKKDFFEFDPSHTLWLAANDRPVIKGRDTAIWRRIKLIPFDVSIPLKGQDPDLAKKLEAELPGILNWAIQGCLEWQDQGLNPPEAVRAATEAYRDDMDVLGTFLAEHCSIEDGAEAEARDLYECYKTWADVSGERKIPRNEFGQQLQERGFETYNHPKHRRVIYRGIRINTRSEATRSNVPTNPIETTHIGTNEKVSTPTFAPNKNHEHIEPEKIQTKSEWAQLSLLPEDAEMSETDRPSGPKERTSAEILETQL